MQGESTYLANNSELYSCMSQVYLIMSRTTSLVI